MDFKWTFCWISFLIILESWIYSLFLLGDDLTQQFLFESHHMGVLPALLALKRLQWAALHKQRQWLNLTAVLSATRCAHNLITQAEGVGKQTGIFFSLYYPVTVFQSRNSTLSVLCTARFLMLSSFATPASAKAETDACLVKPALHLISLSQMPSLQQIAYLKEAKAAFVLFMAVPPRCKVNFVCLVILESGWRILATRNLFIYF